MMFGDRTWEHRNIRQLWRKSGLSVDQVAERLFISYERAYMICYGYVGKRTRKRVVVMFEDAIHGKNMERHS
jgi:hypothetical protein